MNIFNEKLVIILGLQIFVFLTSLSALNTSTSAVSALSKSNVNVNATNTSTKYNLPVPQTNKGVVIEGGGTFNISEEKPAVDITQQHNREHVVIASPNISNATPNNTLFNLTSSTKILGSSSTTSSSISDTSKFEQLKPTYEDTPLTSMNVSESPDHKKISARKGVNFTDEEALPKEKLPKKPTRTYANEEEPYAPSHFQSKSNLSVAHNIPKVPSMLSESNEGKTQKYVVPIVIVILSVPFVAILISILYKRGAEWWKYRHYRRMDFLINGMYDN